MSILVEAAWEQGGQWAAIRDPVVPMKKVIVNLQPEASVVSSPKKTGRFTNLEVSKFKI